VATITPAPGTAPDGTTITASGGSLAVVTPVAAALQKWSSGSSTSGTPATIATLAAAAGKRFAAWLVLAKNGSNSTSLLSVTVTYDDDTTDTMATSEAVANTLVVAGSGIILEDSSSNNAPVLLSATKAVKAVTVATVGAGTSARYASISALEVPA